MARIAKHVKRWDGAFPGDPTMVARSWILYLVPHLLDSAIRFPNVLRYLLEFFLGEDVPDSTESPFREWFHSDSVAVRILKCIPCVPNVMYQLSIMFGQDAEFQSCGFELLNEFGSLVVDPMHNSNDARERMKVLTL